MKAESIMVAILTLCGCASVNPSTPPDPSSTGSMCRAVIAHLDEVNPAKWGGWNGNCPGADVDGEAIAMIAESRACPYVRLYNDEATVSAITRELRKAAAALPEGGCLIFFYSGHGGQVADRNGDEVDGMDEYLCAYDGPIIDDTLAALWQEIARRDILVVFMSDSCNSETQYRHRGQVLAPTLPRSFGGKLIMIAGCADGASSFGNWNGGFMTTALIDALSDDTTWASWFAVMEKKIPADQRPKWTEYGHVTSAHRNRQPFK